MNTLSFLLLLSSTTGVLAGDFYHYKTVNVTLYPKADFKPHFSYTNSLPAIFDSGCVKVSNTRTVSFTVDGGCCEFYQGPHCYTYLFMATDRKYENLGPRWSNRIGSIRCGRWGCDKMTTLPPASELSN